MDKNPKVAAASQNISSFTVSKKLRQLDDVFLVVHNLVLHSTWQYLVRSFVLERRKILEGFCDQNTFRSHRYFKLLIMNYEFF